MIVSRAGVSGDPQQEDEARIAMARARVTVHEAQVAVAGRDEAVVATRSGCDRAQELIKEARALRARDGSPDRRHAVRTDSVDRRQSAGRAPPEGHGRLGIGRMADRPWTAAPRT